MSRTPCWKRVAPLLLVLAAGCQPIEPEASPTTPENPKSPSVASSEPYTLRVVFSGLVPLVLSDESSTPEALWALIPNLDDPSQLPFGQKVHTHTNRLLFRPDQATMVAGARAIRNDGWACNREDEGFGWSFVSLADEHVELDVDSPETSLELVRGRIQPPFPCDPETPGCDVGGRSETDQARDVQWSVHVDGVIERVVGAGTSAPRLQTALVDPAYDPKGAYPLIRARYQFDRGKLQTRFLHTEDSDSGTEYAKFTIDPLEGSGSEDPLLNQAIAQELELVIQVRGDAVLLTRSISNPDSAGEPIVIRRKPGQREVMLRIDNQPKMADSCEKLRLMAELFDDDPESLHFLTLYNLLDRPEVLATQAEIERLTPMTGELETAWNGQCSPPTFTAPGG